ncbi:hypothetical protein ACT3TB_10950 [Micrococcaceae sp. AOP34-BR2-30]
MADEGTPELKRLRLTGARFDGGRLPVDSLNELQKYQSIVRIAAEAEWKQEHPGESVPVDLHNSVSLAIAKIDEGSADIFLAFEQHQAYVQYQEEAQGTADAVLVAAYSGTEIPVLPGLSEDEGYEFRTTVAQLGNTLKPGQTIEYYLDESDSPPITISVETRERAVDALLVGDGFLLAPEELSQPNGLQKSNESLVGKITALDTDALTYRFTLPDGQQLNCHYKNNPALLPDLRKVVNDQAEGPLTRVTGVLHTRTGKLFRFWETASVEQVQFDDTEWGQRLMTFAGLRPNWDGSGAEQISPVALDAAQTVLREITEAGIDRPGVYPTAEGGVLLEWGSVDSVESVELFDDGSFETYSFVATKGRGVHSAGENLSLAIDFVKAVKL